MSALASGRFDKYRPTFLEFTLCPTENAR